MRKVKTGPRARLSRENLRSAKARWPDLSQEQLEALQELSWALGLTLKKGELLYFEGRWYVSHSGLLAIAHRKRCAGIHVTVDSKMSQPSSKRWVFRAVVKKSASQRFVSYGDADPSNVSAVVRGAEMRIAETRAVNRALRKAYGIGICSAEELGARTEQSISLHSKKPVGSVNGNCPGLKVRDRLCQIIQRHNLDPTLVKAYAIDFCKTKALCEATREQVENFVSHLADWATKDRDGLLFQLNTYSPPKENAA